MNADELQKQGVQRFQQKDYEAAAEFFRQAQEAYEAAGQPDVAAEMKTNIGLVHRALGEHDRAATLMMEAREYFAEAKDRKREAQVLGNLGGVYAAQGNAEQALTCYREAADTFLELDEQELYGQTLIAMGDLQVRKGKVMAGAATYEAGLESIKAPSGTQKIIKGLLGVKRRLMGESLPPTSQDEEEKKS